MECSQFKANLIDFRQGTLEEELHRSANLHLSSCPSCSRLMKGLDEVDELIEREKALDPGPFVATRILQRIDREFETPVAIKTPGWIRVLQPVAVALALICGILIGSNASKSDGVPADNLAKTTDNIEFLRSNLYISDFMDEDKVLDLNK